MPNRFQKNQHDLAYDFLVERDGEQCFSCRKKPPPGGRLEIDHLDSNPANNKPRNLHLLCSTCNLSLRYKTIEDKKTLFRIYGAKNVCERERERAREYRDTGVNTATSVVKDLVDFMAGSPEMKTNSIYEIRYRTWIIDIIKDKDELLKHEAVYSGAEYTGCNPITAERYLKKLTSAIGIFKEAKNANGEVIITWRHPPALPPVKKPDARPAADKQKSPDSTKEQPHA